MEVARNNRRRDVGCRLDMKTIGFWSPKPVSKAEVFSLIAALAAYPSSVVYCSFSG
jgi:hypothetical protein